MSDEAANTVQREKKHAVIYFEQGRDKAFKELAARVRSEGGRTTLVWSNRWKGAENLMMEARAVVIQRGCANAESICDAYRKYAHDVEIHYVNEHGDFVEDDEAPPVIVESDDDIVPQTEDELHAQADADAKESREAIEAAGGETTLTADPLILDPEATGATDAGSISEDGGDAVITPGQSGENPEADTIVQGGGEAGEPAGDDTVAGSDGDTDIDVSGDGDAEGSEKSPDTGRTARD